MHPHHEGNIFLSLLQLPCIFFLMLHPLIRRPCRSPALPLSLKVLLQRLYLWLYFRFPSLLWQVSHTLLCGIAAPVVFRFLLPLRPLLLSLQVPWQSFSFPLQLFVAILRESLRLYQFQCPPELHPRLPLLPSFLQKNYLLPWLLPLQVLLLFHSG